MAMVMPNGKPLAQLTGRECITLGPQIGAWLTELGRLVPPDALVNTLGAAKVKAIYNSLGTAA